MMFAPMLVMLNYSFDYVPLTIAADVNGRFRFNRHLVNGGPVSRHLRARYSLHTNLCDLAAFRRRRLFRCHDDHLWYDLGGWPPHSQPPTKKKPAS